MTALCFTLAGAVLAYCALTHYADARGRKRRRSPEALYLDKEVRR